ncbi:MAG: ABC transporter ATP-binding protein [Suilimivivens sp.]
MEENRIIEMKQINKGYMLGSEKVPVLKNVDFRVEKGEFVAILGPSGSGKTTLMNIIGCMDVADSGEYYLDGQPVHSMAEKELGVIRNREIGFIFQNYQLIPTYDILQNIIMPLVIRGMSAKEAEEKCIPVIEMLGIGNRRNHKPSELSGGQKQRASIARALVGEPALLLADEPTGALDSASGKDVLKLFSQIHDLGHTIVMITHDLNVAKSAERIVHIVDGCLEQ